MSHPKSFRPTPRWHVRTYGLFAANPFGQKDFPHPEAAKQGAVTIKKGDSLTLDYRVLLHRGETNNGREIEEVFREFAAAIDIARSRSLQSAASSHCYFSGFLSSQRDFFVKVCRAKCR